MCVCFSVCLCAQLSVCKRVYYFLITANFALCFIISILRLLCLSSAVSRRRRNGGSSKERGVRAGWPGVGHATAKKKAKRFA